MSWHRRKKNPARWLAALLLAVIVSVGSPLAAAADGGTEKNLVITVVEELPAEEIEEASVPLAAFPDTDARRGVRHAAFMGLVFLASAGYVLYFARYEKRLIALRREAAFAEHRWTEARRIGAGSRR